MRRVLVATEGSPVSLEAVNHLVRVLNPDEVELYVLSVVLPAPPDALRASEFYEEAVPSANRAVDGALREVSIEGFRAFGLTRAGEPAAEIVRVARVIGAELIVLGTHGHAGLARESVAEAVLRTAPCGVMIFPFQPAPMSVPTRW
jgi:nucleotide-binding universal stress UspA family protein